MFRNNLLQWYEQHKRDLPWRKTKDPYFIWISEIMSQQTKVETVITYYEKFTTLYPTVFHLAAAEEQEVLKVWEGLGYYSRARNLHAAAKTVVEIYDGKIPDDPGQLGKLKGIGPYTKGAITSIAFGQAEPAVDGNVMRVLSRVLYITDNISEQRVRIRFEGIVRELLMTVAPASFNQGLMELGALVCTPKNPACLHCPVNKVCRALEVGEVDQLPIKAKKKKQRVEEYLLLFIWDQNGRIAIEKRPNAGLLANLWQFPMIEKDIFEKGMAEKMIAERHGIEMVLLDKLGDLRHIFSHIIWKLDIVETVCIKVEKLTGLKFVHVDKLNAYPFSVSHRKAMKYLDKPASDEGNL